MWIQPTQNGKAHVRRGREYEDEQECLQVKNNDSLQTRELKSKMRVLIGKLATSKKQKEALVQQNQSINRQLHNLQTTLRHMVPGFNNTSSTFPIPTELINAMAEFYKCDCLTLFFDVLSELTLKGVAHFFAFTFRSVCAALDAYFQPCYKEIQKVGCCEELEGPVMNVLRKMYQSRHLQIKEKVGKEVALDSIAKEVIRVLNIDGEGNAQIMTYLIKLLHLLIDCRITDPPLSIDLSHFGRKVIFASHSHQALDGFLRPKDQCYVVLPEIKKGEQIVTKCQVLHKDYDGGQ